MNLIFCDIRYRAVPDSDCKPTHMKFKMGKSVIGCWKLSLSILSFSCFSAIILCRLPAKAQLQTPPMTDAEILGIASGNTTIGTFSDRPISYEVFVAPNGRLIGRISDGKSKSIELGRWRVANNRLCGKWDNLKEGKENCFTHRRVGPNVHAYNNDGNLDRIQFFVEGDPFSLQQAANSTTVGMTTPDFEQIIKKRYSSLWRDTVEQPYSVDSARQLYLTNERLTTFDTDALLAKGADSRIDGWSEYASIWPEVFAGIKRFEASEVSNLQVRREGNWALVTFDMSGDSELETGETAKVFKHFTLIWTQTDDGWRIMHEHISDGQPPKTAQ